MTEENKPLTGLAAFLELAATFLDALPEPPERAPEIHVGCQSAYERAQRSADFLNARLETVLGDLYALAQAMDSIDGHTTHSVLGHKTLGGALRNLAEGSK